jgi:hypothetical protein
MHVQSKYYMGQITHYISQLGTYSHSRMHAPSPCHDSDAVFVCLPSFSVTFSTLRRPTKEKKRKATHVTTCLCCHTSTYYWYMLPSRRAMGRCQCSFRFHGIQAKATMKALPSIYVHASGTYHASNDSASLFFL